MADAAADRVWMDGSVKSVYKEFPFQCPSLSLFVVRDLHFIPPRDESTVSLSSVDCKDTLCLLRGNGALIFISLWREIGYLITVIYEVNEKMNNRVERGFENLYLGKLFIKIKVFDIDFDVFLNPYGTLDSS